MSSPELRYPIPRVEIVEAWRTGLALPHLGLEPTGRSFVTLTVKTVKTEAGERLYPFAVEEARARSRRGRT